MLLLSYLLWGGHLLTFLVASRMHRGVHFGLMLLSEAIWGHIHTRAFTCIKLLLFKEWRSDLLILLMLFFLIPLSKICLEASHHALLLGLVEHIFQIFKLLVQIDGLFVERA